MVASIFVLATALLSLAVGGDAVFFGEKRSDLWWFLSTFKDDRERGRLMSWVGWLDGLSCRQEA
jgi:hypothetical protein